MNDHYQKRCDLILDYISQILVYGFNRNSSISLEFNDFTEVRYVIGRILDKFKEFDITFSDNIISILSKVNKNKIYISFTLNNKKEKDMFLK